MTTAASRSSYTSPDTSPTKSDYEAPPTSTIPTRPKYGSAFGSTEGSSIAGPVVQLSVDVTDSMLANRRRRKSSEDGTPRTEKVLESIQHDHRQVQKDTLDDDESLLVATTTATVPLDESPKPIVPQAEKAIPHVPHTKGVTPVSKSQWSQFGLPPNRATMSRLPIAPISSISRPMPMHVPSSVVNSNLELQSPQPRSVTGTVVKKMVMPSKTRLPIGSTASTSHPPIPRPKTPSNTPSSGLSVSLHANTFRAPAYAMGTLKIPASTRTLRTSASQSSLKTKKEVVSMHIPDTIEVEVDEVEDEEQPVKVPVPVQEEKEEKEEEEKTKGVKIDDPAPAPAPDVDRKSVSTTTTKKERESIKSALAGSYFKLYGTPKSKRETQQVENNRSTLSLPEKTSRTRTSRLTLKLDSYNFTTLLGRSENSDGTPKPKPSPSVSRNYPLTGSGSRNEQSPSPATPEGPLTPRVDFDLEGDPMRVVVMTPPMPMDNAYSSSSSSSFSRSILPLHSSRLWSPPLGSGLGAGLTHTKPLGSGSSNRSAVPPPSAIRRSSLRDLREPKFKR
ncbi:hypothetical protein FRB91_003562 [Serendipita sp. 411]|nr:hypothetical protein FRB91_003562 [Serendipita sp. 411]